MKICAYVQDSYAKANYKNECLDTRQFVGLRIIIQCLENAGYSVDWAGLATVHNYDIVLVSLTSDCDWWSFIGERQKWQKGDYKVLIGGAGVLHITPFTRWFYAAMFGRGEDLIVPLVKGIESGNRYTDSDSIAYTDDFSPDKIYHIKQADEMYNGTVTLTETKTYNECAIGCNHKCLFCGYTWHRKFISPYKDYRMGGGLFEGIEDKERAMLDLDKDENAVDWSKLRTTAIDGFSERLRFGVNKKISKKTMQNFLRKMVESDAKPHHLKIFNICGYPTETVEDWFEYLETIKEVDAEYGKREKKWALELHNTPFRPMPATPLACAAASKKNYRGKIGGTLGKELKGGLIYQGNVMWSVESMGTDSLPTEMLSMLAHRGSEADSENIAKLCVTKKFWSASSAVKEATLTKYFDMDYIFSQFEADTLPSRYLRTYCGVDKMWGKTPLEIEYKKRNGAQNEH